MYYQPRGFWIDGLHTESHKKRDPAVEDSTLRLVIWYKMSLTDRCILDHSIKRQLSSAL